jgi:8-oxo-dGTP diphosphatase
MCGLTPNIEPEKRLHVAVGVIRNAEGDVLIAKRAKQLHQGGLWEFPGGKVKPEETVQQALKRELFEELGIIVGEARPLIRVHHDYPDRQVLLDVWQVSDFQGEPYGKELQPVRWVKKESLKEYRFPKANLPIRLAVELPSLYGILDVAEGEAELEIEKRLSAIIEKGCTLLQLRAKSLSGISFQRLANKVKVRCHDEGVKLLLNAEPELVERMMCEGVHLTSQRLMALSERPLGESFLVSASCHNLEELEQACQIAVDFIVLSPLLETASHPEAQPLGWDKLEWLVERCSVPVYGLGGLNMEDLSSVQNLGAQGVAGISLFQKGTG